MFKPMKAKTYGKDAIKFSLNHYYLVSTKYDGNLIKITYDEVTRFYTSDNKPFDLPYHIPQLLGMTLIGEFMYGCEGKLGDRGKSAVLTTFRTNYSKGIKPNAQCIRNINIKIFDVIFHNAPNLDFTSRWSRLNELNLQLPGISLVDIQVMTGQDALKRLESVTTEGWEGLMLRDATNVYQPGKRVHSLIKLKRRNTADLLVIDMEEGLGKCNGTGALICTDSVGRIVRVGSGLNYSEHRNYNFIGKVVEVQYEQILDTYIQPVFLSIRHDKTHKDID